MTTKEEVCARVLEVLDDLRESEQFGLSIPEIHRRLDDVCSEGTVRQAVTELWQNGHIFRLPNPRRRGHIYYIHGPVQGLLRLQTREEIERDSRSLMELWGEDEEEREEVSVSVMQAMAHSQAAEEQFAQAVKSISGKIASEEPIGLILQAAEWFVEDYNALAAEIRRAQERGDMQEVRRKSQELGFRRAKARNLFCLFLRFDGRLSYQQQEVDAGILLIPNVESAVRGSSAWLDRTRAEQRLRERIQGSRWIEVRDVPDNSIRGAAGSDASVADIVVPHRAGSFIPPTPASLFVSAGALRVRDERQGGSNRGYTDYDVDPRRLEDYEDVRAAIEGLIVSPQLRREAISDFRHLRSAMMELRQYTEEQRIIDDQADWHPTGDIPELDLPPRIGILFRDGRIFPLVHRLTDYEGASAPDDVLYGEVVRREIGRFQSVFQRTSGMGPYGGTIYAGVTKAPEFSWLAMLTFWYIANETGTDFEAFYRPPLNDQAVAHLLFWGLAEADPAVLQLRRAFTTFRVIRHFSDIAFYRHPLLLSPPGEDPRVLREDSDHDWYSYIRQHIHEAGERYRMHKRGAPPLRTPEDYGPFLYLCRHSGVAMFYGLPTRMYKATVESRAHLFSPRWEIALDVDNGFNVISRRLDTLLGWITERDGLRADEDHTLRGYTEPQEGLPLMVPDVVRDAHEAVVYSQDRHGWEVQNRLQELFNAAREALAG